MQVNTISAQAWEWARKSVKGICVEVIRVEGSAPCAAGAKLLVAKNMHAQAITYGTIGGGDMEWHCIHKALDMLEEGILHYKETRTLGARASQCCGGRVTILFTLLDTQKIQDIEREEQYQLDITPCLYLFGTGHVGQAIVQAAAFLPLRIRWFDCIAEKNRNFILPENTSLIICDALAECLPPDSFCQAVKTAILVMTHSHILDSLIIEKAIQQDNSAFIGLIGSKTKKERFSRAFLAEGLTSKQVERFHCPIGARKTQDKRPAVIAAQILGEIIPYLF